MIRLLVAIYVSATVTLVHYLDESSALSMYLIKEGGRDIGAPHVQTVFRELALGDWGVTVDKIAVHIVFHDEPSGIKPD
jgi:hypothetical protein